MSMMCEGNLDSHIDLDEDQSVLEFMPASSIHTIEASKYTDLQDLQHQREISESEIIPWLRQHSSEKPLQTPTSKVRLIGIHNELGFPKFPMREETFLVIMREWGFPNPTLHQSAFQVGGTTVFVAGKDEETRINFIVGGGVYPFSIGGIFSFDVRSSSMSGCIIFGKAMKLDLRSLAKQFLAIPDPFTLPMVMAEALMKSAIALRLSYNRDIRKIEAHTGTNSGSDGITFSARPDLFPNYRALMIDIGKAHRTVGLSQLSADRSRLILKFVLDCSELQEGKLGSLKIPDNMTLSLETRTRCMLSSLEHMKLEYQNIMIRLQSQHMIVANLVAQEDVALSTEIARDSKTLAAASRKDSSAMLVLAVLGTVFLPGTFVATVLSLPIFAWDSENLSDVFSPRLWLYFAIAIPLTLVTIGVFYLWLRSRLYRKLELAMELRTHRKLEEA